MFTDLISDLNHDQKTELFKRHITPQLITEWKKGRRLPTEIQVVDVAEVTGAEWADLQKEVTVLRAPEERRQQIAKALHWQERTSSKV
jgi:hypothetical protein